MLEESSTWKKNILNGCPLLESKRLTMFVYKYIVSFIWIYIITRGWRITSRSFSTQVHVVMYCLLVINYTKYFMKNYNSSKARHINYNYLTFRFILVFFFPLSIILVVYYFHYFIIISDVCQRYTIHALAHLIPNINGWAYVTVNKYNLMR